MRCAWKIHWGTLQEHTTQCDRDEHVTIPADAPEEAMRSILLTQGDGKHQGQAGNGVTMIEWMAGDRREYTGPWPGLCPYQPCILHLGHYGDHQP